MDTASSDDEEKGLSGSSTTSTTTPQPQPPPPSSSQQQQQQPSTDKQPEDAVAVDASKPTKHEDVIVKKEVSGNNNNNNNSHRKWIIAMAIVLLVAGVVIAITAPLVKRRNEGKNTFASNEQGVDTDGSGKPPPPESNNSTNTTTTVPQPPPATTSASGFEPIWQNVSSEIGFYDESVVQGYASTADLQQDLTTVAKMMINLIVARSTGTQDFGNQYKGGRGGAGRPEFSRQPLDDTAVVPEEDGSAADESFMGAPPAPAAPALPTVGDDVNDFGSNNQEDEVEEGDKMVSDGTRVFAAYGDYIVAWDAATGKQLAMVQMEEFDTGAEKEPAPPEPAPVDTLLETDERGQRRDSMPYYYNNKPTIRSLLLANSRLIVAVDGGYRLSPQQRILSNHGQTRVLVYETEFLTLDANDNETVLGSMEHLFTREYNGQFVAFRAMGGYNLHTVTTSQVDTYYSLVAPVERYSYEASLTDQEYMDQVKYDAESRIIPAFVETLTKELTQEDGSLPDLARISKFLTHTSTESAAAADMDQYYLYDNGLLNSLTLVHSMNVNTITESQQEPRFAAAGLFLPSYSAQVYASDTFMIVAGQGYDYSPLRRASTESTYLMAMKLTNSGTEASSTPFSIGTVEGSFLNQRSFDVVDNVLRVATTIRRFWRWAPMPGRPMGDVVFVDEPEIIMDDVDDEPPVLETEDTVGDESTSTTNNNGGATLVLVDTTDEPVPLIEEPIMPPIEEESSTENYIITLALPAENDENHGVMQELDRVKLGKPHETFTSVRFYDNVAYAVTFERTDPFYVLNVTDPSDIQVLAEVNITGFSSYLHSINDANDKILAIGQEADEWGQQLGLQISLFDVRNLTDIKVLRHNIETDPDVYSGSSAMWDVMAIRFNRQTGRLIIPVDMSSWKQPSLSFHGFRVYSVTETDIQEDEQCRVEMGNDNELSNVCYYCAFLEPRAMIMNGNMMLAKNHFVKSVDMNDCSTKWSFAIRNMYNSTGGGGGCCGYY